MMLLLVSASAVFAENETTNETELFNDSMPLNDSELFDNSTLINEDLINDSIRDSEILSTNPGVILRFSQLYGQLSLRIEQADLVIAEINDSSIAEQLSSIVEALESLKAEAGYYMDEAKEYDLRQAAIDFVYLKKKSIELVSEFREISHDYFQAGHINALKNKLRLVNESNGVSEKISRMMSAHNALKVRNVVGSVDNETINGIMNGSIAKNQINNVIRNMFQNLNESIRNEVIMQVKENLVRNNINASAKNNEALENAENITQRIRQNIQNRIDEYKERNPNSSISSSVRNNGRGR